jgi:triacylglycerol lipase
MIISTPSYVLIIFRGTDDIRNNRFAEWIGTDFNALKTRTDSSFDHSRIHKGFYKSFQLIEGDLKKTLDLLETKNKPIWLAGHSLGGAMAVISGISLAQQGYHIAGVCSFGGPSVIGNRRFSALTDSLLKEKIQRYEYKLDPVSILSAPGYKTFGKRNWITREAQGKFLLYLDIPERSFVVPRKRIEALPSKRMKREVFSSRLGNLPYELYHHNTQWIVKGLYLLTPTVVREHLPLPEDTFPFIYYAWSKSK